MKKLVEDNLKTYNREKPFCKFIGWAKLIGRALLKTKKHTPIQKENSYETKPLKQKLSFFGARTSFL